jgi:hypothetical protein
VDSLIRWAGLLFFAVAVPTLQAADAPSAGELLKLEGLPLFKAAEHVSFSDNPYTGDELIAIAGRLADELKSLPRDDPGYSRYAFIHFFEEACGKANNRQLDQLIQVYLRLDPTSFEKENVLPALAAQWIHRELRALRDEKIHVKLPDHDVSPSGDLENAPKDLIVAWRLYKQSMEAYEKAFPDGSVENPISFQANNRAFFSVIEDVLLGRGEGAAKKILNYVWGGTCGTGSESLGGPRSLAVFMSLLHERRLPEAVGASLLVSGDRPLTVGDDNLDVRIEFLEACGLDWERMLAGAQTEKEYGESYFAFRNPLLAELAGYGSERAALLLADLARHVKPDRWQAYAYALAALVENNPSKPADCAGYEDIMNTFNSDMILRVAKVPVPPKVQKELVSVVKAFVTPKVSTELARAVLAMFARTRDRETIPTLRSLLGHASSDVSRDAASILCAMGEKVDSRAVTKAAPVSFKILINGQSLRAGFEGDWDVYRGSGSVSDVTVADKDGAFTIKREYFLDPNMPPTGVALHSRPQEPRDELWFDVHLPAPPDLDDVPPIDVKVITVTLSLENLSRLSQPAGTKASVQIRKERIGEESTWSYPESAPRTIEAMADGPIVLPLLQSGTYTLEVELSGAARWIQKVELTPAAPQVPVQLQPGSDVHVTVTGPGIAEDFSAFHLLKNGNEFESPFDDKSRSFKGLPCGNYVLHIPSTEELRRDDVMESYEAGPDEIPHVGRDIAFTIVEGSPATIDLGEIHLEASAK